LALGCSNKFLKFEKNTYSNGRNSFVRNYSNQLIETLPVFKLDDMKIEPKFLIIDVEGFELEVLKGANNSLQKVQALCVEIAFNKNKKIDELLNILKIHFSKIEVFDHGQWKEFLFEDFTKYTNTEVMKDFFITK